MGKKVSFLDCYVAPIREKERERRRGGEREREKDRILVILRPSSAQNVSSIWWAVNPVDEIKFLFS